MLFLCVTLAQAYWKLLWGDEFVTFWIGQQRSFGGIWRALGPGADPNPPLMHVLDWWSTAVFGTGPLAVRLPSIMAMGLGVACLWVFLRRRVAPVYAAAGCLALMTTRGFDYAYDARSYALLMGFAMAALLLWSRSVETQDGRRLLCSGWAHFDAGGGDFQQLLRCLSVFCDCSRGNFLRAEGEKVAFGWVGGNGCGFAALAGNYLRLIQRQYLRSLGPHAVE